MPQRPDVDELRARLNRWHATTGSSVTVGAIDALIDVVLKFMLRAAVPAGPRDAERLDEVEEDIFEAIDYLDLHNGPGRATAARHMVRKALAKLRAAEPAPAEGGPV